MQSMVRSAGGCATTRLCDCISPSSMPPGSGGAGQDEGAPALAMERMPGPVWRNLKFSSSNLRP